MNGKVPAPSSPSPEVEPESAGDGPATSPAGIIPMSDADYFAQPALSHSDTKLLLRSPAHYRHVKDNRVGTYKPEFDFGHAVHELALGGGAGIDVIDADNWRTNAAKDARKQSHEAGRAPLLVADYQQAEQCAQALTNHPVAARLLGAADHTEVGMFWDHDDVPLKAKLDLIAGKFAVDLKTTDYAATDAFGRSAGKYGYATQAAWYLEAMRRCAGVPDPKFLFIVVEKDAPYLVNVIQLDDYDVELGAKRNEQMIDLYRQCRDSGVWPAYGDGINVAQLPRWAEIEMETE